MLFFHSLSVPIAAQDEVQEALWKVPDGTSADFSQTFTVGNSIPLAWNEFSDTSYLNVTNTLLDLWVTSFDWNTVQYAQKLTVRGSTASS